MTLIGKHKINNVDCDVHASTAGLWVIERNGENLSSHETFDGAVKAARRAMRRKTVKVAVPFYTEQGQRGVATGFHASNGKITAKVGNKPVQLETYAKVLKSGTSKKDRDRIAMITEEVRKLEAERRKLVEQNRLHLRKEVEEAIASVADPEDES